MSRRSLWLSAGSGFRQPDAPTAALAFLLKRIVEVVLNDAARRYQYGTKF
jgi:hypothetical protein